MGLSLKNKIDTDEKLNMSYSTFSFIREVFGAVVLKITYEEFNKNRQRYYLEMKSHKLGFFYRKSDIKGKISKRESEVMIKFFNDNKIAIREQFGLTTEKDLLIEPFVNYLEKYKDNEIYY